MSTVTEPAKRIEMFATWSNSWEWFPGKRARLLASLRRIREKETEMLELAESENLIARVEE